MTTTLVLSLDASRSVTHANTIVVGTPLDAITRLEQRSSIATVVLAGTYAQNDDIAIFLAEFYPAIRLEQEI
jgi:hypothetical protein